jgi:hypothetical protein
MYFKSSPEHSFGHLITKLLSSDCTSLGIGSSRNTLVQLGFGHFVELSECIAVHLLQVRLPQSAQYFGSTGRHLQMLHLKVSKLALS